MNKVKEQTGRRYLSFMIAFLMVLQMVVPSAMVSLAADPAALPDLKVIFNGEEAKNDLFITPITTVYNSEKIIVTDDNTIPKPTTPTTPTAQNDSLGYTFKGWFTDAVATEEWEFSTSSDPTSVTDNTTIYAIWTEKFKVTKYNGPDEVEYGSSYSNFNYGDKVPDDVVLTPTGYNKVTEWYRDKTYTGIPWDFETDIVEGETTLYAKLVPYEVTFKTNGGIGADVTDDVSVEKITSIISIDAPTTFTHATKGYEITGWYTTAACNGTAIDLSDIKDSTFIIYNGAGSLTLYAKWESVTYKVTYSANGGTLATDTVHPDDLISGDTVESAPENNPTRSGYNFDGWYTKNGSDNDWGDKWAFGNASTGTPVTENITLYAKWIDSYTVTFKANGGEFVGAEVGKEETDVEFDSFEKGDLFSTIGTIPSLTVPTTYEDYIWVYTNDDGDEVSFTDTVEITKNITVTPRWYYDVTFTVESATVDGETASAKNISYYALKNDYLYGTVTLETILDDLAEEDPNLFESGTPYFQLDSWYSDEECETSAATSFSQNQDLFGKWVRLYKVNFELYGGTSGGKISIDPQYIVLGGKVEEPTGTLVGPANELSTGWYYLIAASTSNRDPQWIFSSDEVDEDCTLYVKWVESIEITLIVDEGGKNPKSYTVIVAEGCDLDTLKTAINEKLEDETSFVVNTWYSDKLDGDVEIDFGSSVLVDDSFPSPLYGTGEASNQMTVNFYVDGKVWISEYVSSGNTVDEPSPDPELDSHEFLGWYKAENGVNAYDFSTAVTVTPLKLYAYFLEIFTVSYETDVKDLTIESEKVTDGNYATEPTTIPTQPDWLFDYWVDENGDEWKFTENKVTANTQLTAKWSEAHTVTFTEGSSTKQWADQFVSVKNNTAINSDDIPDTTIDGYNFLGWYTDEDCTEEFITTSVIKEKTTVYGKWAKIVEYTVTFNANGGKFSDSSTKIVQSFVENTYYADHATNSVPTVTRESHGFVDWYDKETGGTAVDFTDLLITDNIEVYAEWNEQFTYIVKFDNNGIGPQTPAQSFTWLSTSFLVSQPDDPTASGYRFLGWTADAEGKITWDFEKDEITGDTNIYAQWGKTYKVSFWRNGGTFTGDDPSDNYMEGDKIIAPEGIYLDGCIVSGWYVKTSDVYPSDEDPEWDFDEDTVGTEDIILYPLWEDDPLNYMVSIEIYSDPTKIVYAVGDTFSPSGLVLLVNYSNAEPKYIYYSTDSDITFLPSLTTYLTMEDTYVTGYYGTQSIQIPITVKESIRYLTGNVKNTSGIVQAGVRVTLQKNGIDVSGASTVTDENGNYSFEVNDVTPGYYTLYFYQTSAPSYKTRTVSVYVTGYNQTADEVIMPDGLSSGGIINNTGLVITGIPNLDALADEISTGESNSDIVRVEVSLDEATNINDIAYINAYKTDGETIGKFLDINVTKYLTFTSVGSSSTVPITSLKETTLEIQINLPTELQNKGSYYVYRMHEGAMDKLDTLSNTNGEYIVRTPTSITLHVNRFCTYAISYTEHTSTGETEGDNEVDGDRYTVTTRKLVNGDEESNSYVGGGFYLSENYPIENTKVSVYPTAYLGYTLDYIVAVNENGVPVTLTENTDGTYFFTQGGSPVTLTLAFRNLPIPVSPEGYEGFWDVNESDWYYNQVLKCANLGYMVGVDYGIFSPTSATTRGQIVQILYTLEGKPEASNFSGFPDVYAYDYYAQAVTWAKECGVVSGYDDGYFRPNQEVTRQEMAVIFYKYAEESVNVTPIMWPFTVTYGDDFAIATWAKQAVTWCTNKGLFSGKNANLFAPSDYAIRAEVATCVLALMDQQVEVVQTIL